MNLRGEFGGINEMHILCPQDSDHGRREKFDIKYNSFETLPLALR